MKLRNEDRSLFMQDDIPNEDVPLVFLSHVGAVRLSDTREIIIKIIINKRIIMWAVMISLSDPL